MEMNAVVIGGSNIDVCAKSRKPLIQKDSNIGDVEFALGGVARNIAEDLSLLGANTSLLTAVGTDSFGHVVTDNAFQQGITLLAEPLKDKKTGVYVYIADSDGDFVVGVNDMDITSQITPEVIEQNINALYFTDYVILEANLPQETIEKICSYNFKLVADCVSSIKCTRLKNVLGKLYLLKANYLEACELTGKSDTADIIKSFVSLGLQRGIITLGSKGAMCYENLSDGIHWYKVTNMPGQVVVDTSGCGDAMLAGFMIGVMRGKCLKDCLVIGQSAAKINADSFSSVNREMSFSLLKETVKCFKEKVEVEEGIIK